MYCLTNVGNDSADSSVAVAVLAGAATAVGSCGAGSGTSSYLGATMRACTSRTRRMLLSRSNLRMPRVRLSRRTPSMSSTSMLAKAHGRLGSVMLKFTCSSSSVDWSITMESTCVTVMNAFSSSTNSVAMNIAPSSEKLAPEKVPSVRSRGTLLPTGEASAARAA